MARRQRADLAEVQRVYREQLEGVYAFFAYSVDPPTAEDLTASTFERVLRSWSRFDSERASEKTWVLAIARNLLIDHYRSRSYRDAPSVDENPGLLDRLADDRDLLEAALAPSELRRLLAPLDEREREVLALRYAADLTAAEVARVMELTVANVQQIASRALRRLRAEAEEGQGQRLT